IVPHHLRHAVVRHAREPGRAVRGTEELRRGQSEGEDLAHAGKLRTQHLDAVLDVPEHAQAAHALHHAGLLRVRLDELEICRRHDVVEDVDLVHGPFIASAKLHAMDILVAGAGPAGLYFSYLAKRRHPEWRIRVVEQNAADSTFGFGVVFS